MSIFPKRPWPAKVMLGKSLCISEWLDNNKINKYAKFDSNIDEDQEL